MFETPYKHEVIKNTVLAFGALFSKLKIIRNNTDGTQSQLIQVPITYGPKEKIFVRLRQGPDFDNTSNIFTSLPRLAFEIVGISYDSSRVSNRNNKIACHKPDGSIRATFAAAPYNLEIQMYLISKGTQDSLDVIEQIAPVFMPEYSMKIRTIQGMNITQDIPVILNNITASDDYEGDFSQRRLVVHTFSFTAKVQLYGGVGAGNVISRTDTDLISPNSNDKLARHTSVGSLTTGEITTDFWE